jgi:hypothetical protein
MILLRRPYYQSFLQIQHNTHGNSSDISPREQKNQSSICTVSQNTHSIQNNLEKNHKAGFVSLHDFKIHYKAPVGNTMWNWCKTITVIGAEYSAQGKSMHYGQLVLGKVTKITQWGTQSFNKWYWENWILTYTVETSYNIHHHKADSRVKCRMWNSKAIGESTREPAWNRSGVSKQNRQMGLHQTNKLLRVREATKSKETDCRVRENICKPLFAKEWILKIHKGLRHLKQVKVGKEPEQTFLKRRQWARHPWLMPVILARWKIVFRRISFWAQPGQNVHKTPFQQGRNYTKQKTTGKGVGICHPDYLGKLKTRELPSWPA